MNKLIIPAVIVAIAALSPGARSQAPNPDAKTLYERDVVKALSTRRRFLSRFLVTTQAACI